MRIFILLFLISFSSASAKIIVNYWPGTMPNISRQNEIQSLMEEIGKEYIKPEYAEKGPIDFVNTPEEFKIHFVKDNPDEPAYMFCLELFFHNSLIDNQAKLRRMAFHEFSHLYDNVIVDRSRGKGFRQFIRERKTNKTLTSTIFVGTQKTHKRYLADGEERAKEREHRYLNNLLHKTP